MVIFRPIVDTPSIPEDLANTVPPFLAVPGTFHSVPECLSVLGQMDTLDVLGALVHVYCMMLRPAWSYRYSMMGSVLPFPAYAAKTFVVCMRR